MRILFCNIARMTYYKGIIDGVDEPQNGGSYVVQTGDAAEQYNFVPIQEDDCQKCFGFVETKHTNGSNSNQLHIERLEDVPAKAEEAEHVLVIWCATYYHNETAVVGWYKDAKVFRHYEIIDIQHEDGAFYPHYFNVEANADQCVLLPLEERNPKYWWAPRKKKTKSFGFGQANVWFAEEDSAEQYLNTLVQKIDSYRGENYLWKWPETAGR